MPKFVQLDNNAVTGALETTQAPDTALPPGRTFVKVVEYPAFGSTYDADGDTFTAPTPIDPAVQAAMDADRQTQMKINLALVAYIWKVTHGGTNPTGAQLNAEVTVVKNIYKALP